ncbi:tail fiber protein [Vibrio phage NF]|uniref:Hemagglutinin protein n=1 Tax=Vibrio phage NF TaxID=2686202 RepID=A0A6B9J044_9CAUD|nr:tail fiber protein [Vibrio phage NF]QGZ13277.1 putative hemagglutinin protein [Vibrio phage NF]
MPSIQVTGQLVDPTTGVEGSADIRIASLINYGQTTKKSISHKSTDSSGNYDFQLVYGKHLIFVKYEDERIYIPIGYAVVGDSTPDPIDLIQLTNLSDENPPSELVTELQKLREDTLNDIVSTSAEVLENAGYKGLWPDTGGSALKGETWQTQVGGIPTGEYYIALQNTSIDPIGDNVNWREDVTFNYLLSKLVVDYELTVTVGSGGDYSSINEAISFLSKKYASYVDPKTYNLNQLPIFRILLLSGFVMREQLLVQGVYLGWAVIVAEDAEVTIARESLITPLSGRYPAFGARMNATLPVIGAQFVMDESGDGSEFEGGIPSGKTYDEINAVRDGVFTTSASSFIAANCGVKNASGRGYHVSNGGMSVASGANFQGARQAVARVANGTMANLRDFQGQNGKHNGCQFTNAFVSMPRADFSGSAYCGIFSQGSIIRGQDVSLDNCQSATVNAGYDGAIYADGGSEIYLAGGSADDSGRAVIEAYNSKIVLFDSKSNRSFSAARSSSDSIIEQSSIIIANNIDLSDSGGTCLNSTDAIDINLTGGNLTNPAVSVAEIKGGNVNLRGVSGAGTSSKGVFTSRNATVVLDDGDLKGHAEAINADGDSDVSAISLDIENCGNNAVVANSSARVNLRASISSGSKATVLNGGEIDAYNCDIELSQTPNRQMPDGLIKSEKVTYNKGSVVIPPGSTEIEVDSGIDSSFPISNEDVSVTPGGGFSGVTFYVQITTDQKFKIKLVDGAGHAGMRFNWQALI